MQHRIDRLKIKYIEKKYFTVKGCRGSGTNYLRFILEENTSLQYVEPYWKHDIVQEEKQYYKKNNILVFHIYKPFLAWQLSLYKYKWHMQHYRDLSFSEFIELTPVYSVIDNGILADQYKSKVGCKFDMYESLYAMWSLKNDRMSNIADYSFNYRDILRVSDSVETVFEFDTDRKKYYLERKYLEEYV